MYLDDLPAWALVGDGGEGHTEEKRLKTTDDMFIFTHRRIDIGSNVDQIVDFNVTAGKRVKLVEGETVHFTYEVEFKTSDVDYAKRFEKYLDPTFFQHRVSPELISDESTSSSTDPLVLNLQLFHDGHLPRWARVNDSDAHAAKRYWALRQDRRA